MEIVINDKFGDCVGNFNNWYFSDNLKTDKSNELSLIIKEFEEKLNNIFNRSYLQINVVILIHDSRKLVLERTSGGFIDDDSWLIKDVYTGNIITLDKTPLSKVTRKLWDILRKPLIYTESVKRYMSRNPFSYEERPRQMCKCGYSEPESLHTCPFKEDMNGDYKTLCNCCWSCRDGCAGDI